MTLILGKNDVDGLPYSYSNYVSQLQLFFLGIEGGALAAEECRSTSRALPLGTMIGLSVLLIGATTTWFVCSGLVPAERLGESGISVV